jgi:hypothetical protein
MLSILLANSLALSEANFFLDIFKIFAVLKPQDKSLKCSFSTLTNSIVVYPERYFSPAPLELLVDRFLSPGL